MPAPLKPLVKGKTPTLLDAQKGNELISAVNSLLLAKVSPNGFGAFVIADGHTVLDLGALAQQLVQINETLSSIANALQNPNFSIVCNGNGTITATLTFPVVVIS